MRPAFVASIRLPVQPQAVVPTRVVREIPRANAPSEHANEPERGRLQEFREWIVGHPVLRNLADGERTLGSNAFGDRMLMGEDSCLPVMPDKPTLFDFFYRHFDVPAMPHLLQGAFLTQKTAIPERMARARLLHVVATTGSFRTDHCYRLYTLSNSI